MALLPCPAGPRIECSKEPSATPRPLGSRTSRPKIRASAETTCSKTSRLGHSCIRAATLDIPILTIVNKVGREGRDPFELLDKIESRLARDVCPMSWPIGMGVTFSSLYDLAAGGGDAAPGRSGAEGRRSDRICRDARDGWYRSCRRPLRSVPPGTLAASTALLFTLWWLSSDWPC